MKAYLKQTRISSKKVNVVAALVRGKKVTDALIQLKFVPKRSAPIIAKLIASAAANAENNFKQDKEKLMISKIIVNEGMTLKRGMPVSRGRWHPIKKRTARVSVELSPIVEEKVEAKKAAKPKKKVAKVEKAEKVNTKKVSTDKKEIVSSALPPRDDNAVDKVEKPKKESK
jgi:large subunit ribosomal protein L22